MSILTTGDVNGFFEQVVGSVLEERRVEASCGAKEYLVGMLVDFAHPEEVYGVWERPMTFLLNEALEAPAAERLGKLKGVGDRSLYVSGLFYDHLEAKGVDAAYVARVGATAYGTAARLLEKGDGQGIQLFGELANKFERFVDVLHEVADALFAGSARDSAALVKLYERWQKTGSARLGRELVARGLIPIKGAGGIQ